MLAVFCESKHFGTLTRAIPERNGYFNANFSTVTEQRCEKYRYNFIGCNVTKLLHKTWQYNFII
jgi:hypothetical protein